MSGLRTAYLVLAHNDAPHLARLCRALHPSPVFVHVDAKAVGFPVEKIATLPGVTIVSPFTRVYWGDFSMIEATLTLLRTAILKGPFDRYVLLSGSCYPIRSLASIEQVFESEPSKEWLALTPITPQSHLNSLIARHWRMTPMVGQTALDSKLRMVWNKISKWRGRDLESETGMKPYYGSQWWALSGACVEMIMNIIENQPALIAAYRSVYAPDEHFFQTIVANSKFGASAIAFEDRGETTYRVAPLHLISENEDKYFGSSEAEFIEVSKADKLFLRKVSTERSGPLLDRIDREILGISQ